MLRKATFAVAAAYALSSALSLASGASARPMDPPGVGQSAAPDGAPPPPNVAAGGHDNSYVPLTACRVVDTKKSKAGKLRASIAQTFYLSGTFGFEAQGGAAGGCGVPVWASAVTATIAVVETQNTGYLRAWAAGRTEPSATSLLFTKSFDQSSGATIPVTSSGATVKAYGMARVRNSRWM